MAQDARTKITFVLPLDFSHRQQAVDQISLAALARVSRGGFVFDNVSAFEPAGAIHRRKPAGDVTQQTKRAAHHHSPQFAPFVWTSTQSGKHLAD